MSGKFANTSNASSCKDCPAGRNLVVVATNANYHDEEEDCQVCASGKYNFQPGLNIDCFDCETALEPGAVTCDGCDPGKFRDGQTSKCEQCGPGQFSGIRNANSCFDCPKGYHGVEYHCQKLALNVSMPRGTFGDARALANISLCKPCQWSIFEVDSLQSSSSVPCKRAHLDGGVMLLDCMKVWAKNCGAGLPQHLTCVDE